MEEPMMTEEQRDELKSLCQKKQTCPINRASCSPRKGRSISSTSFASR